MNAPTLNIAALDRVAKWLEAGAPCTATPGGPPVTGFDMSRGVAIDAALAARVLRHLIATGDVNWELQDDQV